MAGKTCFWLRKLLHLKFQSKYTDDGWCALESSDKPSIWKYVSIDSYVATVYKLHTNTKHTKETLTREYFIERSVTHVENKYILFNKYYL